MSQRNLDKLFHPASVAVFGASAREGTVGQVLTRNLRRAGFKGRLMLVNPHRETLDGAPVFPGVAHLPETPDLAVIATPPASIPPLIAELGARGTKAAVIISAGFAEAGAGGAALQQAMFEAAAPHTLRIVGPNCVGVMVPAIGLDASFSHIPPLVGDLAFVSQSGAMITAVLDWAEPHRIGFSHVVSLGDMADVDFGDMINYLAADPGTRAILLYVEGITHARKFMSAARAAARSKPVLALKVGRFAEGARAVRSHTGALAGSDAVYEAAFRRAGVLRVVTMPELFEAVETLALTGPQSADGLAILTNGGGPGVMATDALIAQGGRLAELSGATLRALDTVLPRSWSRGNPVDIIGDAPPERYQAALKILLADQSLGAIVVLNSPTAIASPEAAAAAVVETLAAPDSKPGYGRNVLTSWLGEHSAVAARRRFAVARIATYDTPDAAVRGFLHRLRYRRGQEMLMETPPARPEDALPDVGRAQAALAAARAQGREWLDPEEMAEVLAAYGIPAPALRIAEGPASAAAAAEAIGYPVALKIRSPDLPHKSDVGGVALNLGNPRRVLSEAEAMLARVTAARPDARIDGFLVQQMVVHPGAFELILGIVDDAVFGPVVMFGAGGLAVELLHDTTLELPPLNAALARRAIERTRIGAQLKGFRSVPPADLDAIVDAMLRVAQMASDLAELAELDINPLLADAAGVVAVDARLRIAAARGGARRLAITPYPKELEGTAELRDGTKIRLRPIRPEDEPLLQDLLAHMTQEDIRMRFFTPLHGLPHQLAARLSQIDYDREMALIAFPAGQETALGVVRFVADPDNRRAEYAIALRSDWKGRGLGYFLMGRILEIAARRGVGELIGDVRRENEPMLQMAHEFGFAVEMHPDEADLVRVRKRL